jgi:hypothetical protein
MKQKELVAFFPAPVNSKIIEKGLTEWTYEISHI